jgi:hypothetical protein
MIQKVDLMPEQAMTAIDAVRIIFPDSEPLWQSGAVSVHAGRRRT